MMRYDEKVTVRAYAMNTAATFVVALFIALACVGPPWVEGSSRCSPAGAVPHCPESEDSVWLCCSDDPAALELGDLAGPALPSYERNGEQTTATGTPLFSAARNHLSHSGLCVKAGSVAPAFALADPPTARGCPIPCNPSWDPASITAVCGQSVYCCQTVELDEADCVFDASLGDAGCWRPVRGEDIEGLGGADATSWSPDAHATHQDPGGHGCADFVAGLSDDELDAAGVTANEVMLACYRRLGAADQRGFCLGGPGVAGCPLTQPSYRDACEQKNDTEGLAGCG